MQAEPPTAPPVEYGVAPLATATAIPPAMLPPDARTYIERAAEQRFHYDFRETLRRLTHYSDTANTAREYIITLTRIAHNLP